MSVGTGEGAAVGSDGAGSRAVGNAVSTANNSGVGTGNGCTGGAPLGAGDGNSVGVVDSGVVGADEGDVDNDCVGRGCGDADGVSLGAAVGVIAGALDGDAVGIGDGSTDGVLLGAGEGGLVGKGLGSVVGISVGAGDGEKVRTAISATSAELMLSRRPSTVMNDKSPVAKPTSAGVKQRGAHAVALSDSVRVCSTYALIVPWSAGPSAMTSGTETCVVTVTDVLAPLATSTHTESEKVALAIR